MKNKHLLEGGLQGGEEGKEYIITRKKSELKGNGLEEKKKKKRVQNGRNEKGEGKKSVCSALLRAQRVNENTFLVFQPNRFFSLYCSYDRRNGSVGSGRVGSAR